MNEKLLTIYWNLLVILLFGDAVVGVIWLFRYNILVTNLRNDLKLKLNNEYGFHTSFEVSTFYLKIKYSFKEYLKIFTLNVKCVCVCCRKYGIEFNVNFPAVE